MRIMITPLVSSNSSLIPPNKQKQQQKTQHDYHKHEQYISKHGQLFTLVTNLDHDKNQNWHVYKQF